MKIIENRFVKNTGWLIAQNIYTMLLSLIIGAVSARYLGPSNFGLLGYASSLISLFSVICTLGFDSILINELVTSPSQVGEILGTCFLMRLIASIIGYIGLIGMVIGMNNSQLLWAIVALQGLSMIAQTYEVFAEWFNSKLMSKYVVFAYVAGLTLTSIFKVVLLIMKASVILFALASALQIIICAVVIIFIFMKQKDFKISFSFACGKKVLSKSHHYIIMSLAIVLYTQMDKVMIGKMLNEYEVGIYTAAVNISSMWEFVPIALINSARPLILGLRHNNYKQYIQKLETLFGAITLLSIIASIMICLFNKLIILILYGNAYLDAGSSLNILIWSTMFAMLGTVRGIWIIAENLNQYGKYYIVLGAIFNLVFNYIAIGIWGIVGAALGTLLTQFCVCFVFPAIWKDTRKFGLIYMNSILHIWKNMRGLLTRYRW